MKSHLISISFDTPNGWFSFKGLVNGRYENNRLYISPNKLFKTVFGFDLPSHSRILYH